MPASRGAKWRQGLLIAVLLLLCLLWAAHHLDQHFLAKQVAEAAVDDVAADLDPGVRSASIITVSRTPLFIGTPEAKVEVFIAEPGSASHRPSFAIEYHFARVGDAWELQDSGSCFSAACMIRGEEALEQQARR